MRLPRNAGRLLVLVALLAACAVPGTSGGPAGGGPRPTPSPAAPRTELTITVKPAPAAAAQTWTLSCQPAGGTHPRVAEACAFLAAASPELLAPVPAGQSCTQIFGGSQVATVRGTWAGEPVDAQLRRNNGCEMARWDKLKPLIGAAGG